MLHPYLNFGQLPRFGVILLGLLLAILTWVPQNAQAQESQFSAEQLEFFEKEVRPLLSTHCYECHSADSENLKAGLSVDSRAALIEGGDSGESIVPGDSDGSLFMEVVRWESYEMPPNGKLPDENIETFAKWIQMGAPWPSEAPPESSKMRDEFDLEKRRDEFWVWQPIENPPVPQVADTSWPKADLDNFILAKLEEKNLAPSDDANRLAIMRRLYYDLIGLPPTAAQTRGFIEDDAPDAAGKTVVEFPLICQTKNHHLETRMARKLSDGTYLAPHLLDFAVVQYAADGSVLKKFDTTVEGDPERKIHTWPFTAISSEDGHTFVTCTNGHRVVKFDAGGKVVWTLTNDDLPGPWLKDPCGAQLLPNGNLVITSYAAGRADVDAPKLFEVTPEKEVVWTYVDGEKKGIHHFQILDTNGIKLSSAPKK